MLLRAGDFNDAQDSMDHAGRFCTFLINPCSGRGMGLCLPATHLIQDVAVMTVVSVNVM